jgi:hypothetical protein
VPIRVFMTGDLAFHATILGKEGVDKAHCMWCKLKKAEWQVGNNCKIAALALSETSGCANHEGKDRD